MYGGVVLVLGYALLDWKPQRIYFVFFVPNFFFSPLNNHNWEHPNPHHCCDYLPNLNQTNNTHVIVSPDSYGAEAKFVTELCVFDRDVGKFLPFVHTYCKKLSVLVASFAEVSLSSPFVHTFEFKNGNPEAQNVKTNLC